MITCRHPPSVIQQPDYKRVEVLAGVCNCGRVFVVMCDYCDIICQRADVGVGFCRNGQVMHEDIENGGGEDRALCDTIRKVAGF